MKDKLVIPIVLFVLIILMGYIWWSSPVHFLDEVNANEVLHVEVFNGQSGEEFVVDNKNDISYIVSNIQKISLKREKVSLGYMGYGYKLKFYNLKDNKIDEFIVNSNDTLRKDPFFYKDTSKSLCKDYLKGLEAALK